MSRGPNPVDGAGRARYAARIVGRPEGFGEAGPPNLAVQAMRLWRRRAERDRAVAAQAALAQAGSVAGGLVLQASSLGAGGASAACGTRGKRETGGCAHGDGMLTDLVVWYLFLGGTGAGLLLVAAVFEMLSPQAVDGVCARAGRYAPRPAYRRFFGPAYGVGTAAVLLGMLCLLLDLGRADRALSLFLQPVPSFISVGAYALVALVVLSALLAAVWTFGVEGFRVAFVRVVRVLVVAVAGVVVAYTGLFLASMPAVPLWASPWLPPLFVASALSCGCALLACTCVLTGSGEEFASTLRRVQKADVAAIACELAVLAAFGIAALGGSETARLSMERLVAGDLAPAFWGAVVALGLVAPGACEAFGKRVSARVAVFACAFVLVGGFFLRWCIAQAGMPPDLVASTMVALGIQ